MAYFNHAFRKTFLGTENGFLLEAGRLGVDIKLTPGQFAFVNPKTWQVLDAVPGTCCNLILAGGALYQNDKIGPFHGGYTESNKSKEINPKYVSRFYNAPACDPSNMIVHVGNTLYTSGLDPVNADCCKTFLCGETYNLRLDLKGSPALRMLNRNSYLTADYYTGCCPNDSIAPVAVDSTEVFIGWANQFLASPLISPFIQIVVTTEAGDLLYAPGTLDTDGNPVLNTWDTYVSPGHTEGNCAGFTIFGAYVDTKFGDCTFQLSDFYEKEPVLIYASEVDLNGDPCAFTGLCVITECEGRQANGLGETVARDVILSEAYRQNFFHSDLRIREITQGNQMVGCGGLIERNAQYDRYFIQHNVPRFNNPSSTFDNDQYLLEVVVPAGSDQSAFTTFVTTWLDDCGAGACVFEEYGCGDECIPVIPVVPVTPVVIP